MSGSLPQSCQLPKPPNASAVASQSAAQLHGSTTSLPERTSCKVCGVRPIAKRNGALSCVACESFYYRHRNKASIGQCKNSGECEKLEMFDGCTQCRFQKCLEAGMCKKSYMDPSSPLENTGNDGIALPPSSQFYEQTTSSPEIMICKACGVREAKGKRYGVMSCKGCEQFFFRNIGNSSMGQCRNSGECHKFPTCRRCIPCRFQKCLNVGMKYRNRSPSFLPENTRNKISPSSSLFPESEPSSLPAVRACAVCGHKAKGWHFGVLACESCRSFFCRAKPKWPIGFCERGGICNDGCIPCRYRKCRRAGMGRKEEAEFRRNQPGLAIVLDILGAHRAICEYTEDRMKKIVVTKYPWTPDNNTDQMTNRVYAWKAYSMQLERDIESTGYFIRKLKDKLSSDDRVELIKKHFFQMHMVRTTRALNRNGLLLPDGRLIDSEFFKALYGEELAEGMISFAEEALNIFKINDDGLAMMLTMSFYSEIAQNGPILHKFESPEELVELRQEYRRHFIEWCDKKEEPRTFRNIHLMLEKLKQLDNLHKTEVINFLRSNAKHFAPDTFFAKVYLN